MQGRTAYGGASAALAFEAARCSAPDLPPLRSAQVSFVGPLGGALEASATLLRRGRNAAFVQADVVGEAGLGLRATFVFMGALDSHVDHDDAAAPPVPPPEAAPVTHLSAAPGFTRNFDLAFAQGKDGPRAPDILRWARVKDRDGLHPMTEIMLVGDALPPAAMMLFERQGPISSMTWMVNLLTAEPRTRDGWWLLRASANYAKNGCSSQVMGVWSRDGAPAASGMQSVALFV